MVSATDYYPFGMSMPTRSWQAADSIALATDLCISCTELHDYLLAYGADLTDSTAVAAYINAAQPLQFSQEEYYHAISQCQLLEPLLHTDSLSGIVQALDDSLRMGTRDFSLETWFKKDKVDGQMQQELIYSVLSPNYFIISLKADTSLMIVTQEFTGMLFLQSFVEYRLPYGLDTTQWHHLAVKRVGNDMHQWQLWLDGQRLSPLQTFSNIQGGNFDAFAPVESWSNAYNPSVHTMTNLGFRGALRHSRKYARQMDSLEIVRNYHSGWGSCATPHSTDSLLYTLPQTETTGNTVYDHLHHHHAQLDSLPGSQWRHSLRPSPHCIPTETSCLCHTDTTQVLAGGYRYGFNGKENDREWGNNVIQDYGFRLYSPSLGKFLSVDPLTSSYPFYTPYGFAGLNPILNADLDGLEPDPRTEEQQKTSSTMTMISNNIERIQADNKRKFNESMDATGSPLDNPMHRMNGAYISNNNYGVQQSSNTLLGDISKATTEIGGGLGLSEHTFNRSTSLNEAFGSKSPMISDGFKRIGRKLFFVSIGVDIRRYNDGEIDGFEFAGNTVINTVATFGGPVSASFGIGVSLLPDSKPASPVGGTGTFVPDRTHQSLDIKTEPKVESSKESLPSPRQDYIREAK